MAPETRESISNLEESLLCKICSKRCANRLSKNRHQLYCRKKSGEPNIRKSCFACRKAKIKCNSVLPCCGRCVEKNLVCYYEETSKTRKNESKKRREDANFENGCESGGLESLESPSVVLSSSSCPTPDSLNFSLPDYSSLDWVGLETDDPDTSSKPDDVESQTPNDLIPFETNVQFENSNFEFPYDLEFSPLYPIDFDDSLEIHTIKLDTNQEFMFSTPYLIFQYTNTFSRIPSNTSALLGRQSPFIETQDSRLGGNHIGRYMLLENIRSYFLAFSEPSLFPPFIHHSSFETSSIRENANLEVEGGRSEFASIDICRDITMVFAKSTEQGSPSLWEDVSKERERMNNTYATNTPTESLAMLQAITTYIILRIFSKESFSIDFDNHLIQTMTNLAIHTEKSGFLCTGEVMGHRPQWHEWIHMESKRRTITLLFILHLLFEINPGQRAKALAGISLLPLPAPKSLWSASTENEWKSEYDALLGSREGRRYLNYADMLYLGQGGGADDPRRKDLNRWMVSLDGFGIVVMMAATTL